MLLVYVYKYDLIQTFSSSMYLKIKNPKSPRELKFSTFELLRFLLGLIGSLAVFGEPAVSAT